MKNLLPRVLWDFVIGVLVGVVATGVALIIVGFILQASFRLGDVYGMLRGGLVSVGYITLFGTLLVVAIYEVVMYLRARGKMAEPGTTESRLLSREALLRALISGAVAGVYIGVITFIFALLARGALELDLIWVFLIGLLPAAMLISAGALAYAYIGSDMRVQQRELGGQERTTLLALPLALAVLFGLFFGAAAGGADGVVSAVVAALLTYALVSGLQRLRWSVIRRLLAGLLRARGGPTIKVVSTHKA